MAPEGTASPGVEEVHILWISEGMSCDGDSVSITAAGQPGKSYAESLALFGLPVTEPFQDTINGETFQVQWFERARFEHHPDDMVDAEMVHQQLRAGI